MIGSDDPPGRFVFANDLPYSDGEEDPCQALASALAVAVDDWGDTRAKSWVYGIVLGWDDGDDTEAMEEQAVRHGWSDDTVARLRRLHAAWERPHPAESILRKLADWPNAERTPDYGFGRRQFEVQDDGSGSPDRWLSVSGYVPLTQEEADYLSTLESPRV